MKKSAQLIVSSIIYLIFLGAGLIFNLPAIQAFRVLQVPGGVAVQGLQGTVWKGRVQQISVSGIEVQGLEYRFKPLCLLKLSVCYQVESEAQELSLNLEYQPLWSELLIENSRAALPMEMFDQVPNLLFKPKGQISLEITSLSADDQMRLQQLSGTLTWSNAGVAGEEQVIGNYRAEISSTSKGLEVRVSDRESLLGVEGSLNLDWNGQYGVDLALEKRPDLDPALVGMLDSTTRKRGLDGYTVRLSGRLPRGLYNELQAYFPAS